MVKSTEFQLEDTSVFLLTLQQISTRFWTISIANFSFSLTVPSTVQCEVIDLLGRSVLSRITEEYGTGEQNISFSVEGLPSGVYSVRLTVRTAASVHTETVRLMVVK